MSPPSLAQTTSRPGPLRDLPPGRFSSEPNIETSCSSPAKPRANKRPLPPGAVIVESPVKWRIIGQGSIPTSRSDETYIAHRRSASLGHADSARRLEFVASPSPASAVLDQPMGTSGGHAGTISSSISTQSIYGQLEEGIQIRQRMTSNDSMSTDSLHGHSSSGASSPWPASYSDHYPGFDVYRDPIGQDQPSVTAPARFKRRATPDAEKENVPPSPETKSTSPPSLPWMKAGLSSPHVIRPDVKCDGDGQWHPFSPLVRSLHSTRIHEGGPFRSRTTSSPVFPSPPSATFVASSSFGPSAGTDLGERRRILEDEVDDSMSWSDDVDCY